MTIHDRIRQAAEALVAEGVWPTVADVRHRLGSGSNTTINATLKDWRHEFLARDARQRRLPEIPESLATLFSQVWEQSCAVATTLFDEDRAVLEQERLEWQSRLEQAEQALAESAAKLAVSHEALAQAEQQSEADRAASKTAQAEALRVTAELEAVKGESERQRELLLSLQMSAEQRVADAESRAARQVELEREEAQRRETLAYERLEGLRLSLFEQVEEERRATRVAREEAARREAEALESASRLQRAAQERLMVLERERGRLESALEALTLRLAESAADNERLLNEVTALRAATREPVPTLK